MQGRGRKSCRRGQKLAAGRFTRNIRRGGRVNIDLNEQGATSPPQPRGSRNVQQSLGGWASKHALTLTLPRGPQGPRPEQRRGATEMLRRTAVFLLLCALL